MTLLRLLSALRAPSLILALAAALPAPRARADIPRPDHLGVVIEENHSDSEVLGNPNAPYMTALAAQSANFTNAYAIEHPSLPNYLDLCSGSNQGVHDDNAVTPRVDWTSRSA